MRLHPSFAHALLSVREEFLSRGGIVKTETWQSIPSPRPMFEVNSIDFSCYTSEDLELLREEIRPHLPWADAHFEERVSGMPLNPGRSYQIWPFYARDKEMRNQNDLFSHTYMERFWPKRANKPHPEEYLDELGKAMAKQNNRGIRYEYGDLDDLVNLLGNYPNTRQAYLPVWFPEDTGNVNDVRVPCTLGYLFSQRNGYFHITYYIRSCDYLRHFRDDIYLAVRLMLWVLDKLRTTENPNREYWFNVKPGIFTMHIESLHVFDLEKSRI